MSKIINHLEKILVNNGMLKEDLETIFKYFEKYNSIAKAMDYYEQYLNATYFVKFKKHYFFKR